LWNRHLRWSQIRRTLGVFGYLLELLLLPHIWLLLAVACALFAAAPVASHSPTRVVALCSPRRHLDGELRVETGHGR
jgi:hypothetical protein